MSTELPIACHGRRAASVCLAVLAALCAWTGWTAADAQQSPSRHAPHRLATHLTAFGLPFAIDDPHQRFVEVQLYVSKDRGQTWQFYGRQPTDARSFPFQSSGDGEYWFAIKTLDRDRQLHPDGDLLPEQIVLIDTQRPVLDFRIQTDAAGRVVVRWRAEDENIDPASVRLEYRPLISANDAENAWVEVPYRAVTQPQAGVFADQYAWWLSISSQEVLVRMTIADLAGNQAIAERQISSPRVIMKSGQLAMSNPAETAAEFDAASSASNGSAGISTEDGSVQRLADTPGFAEYGLPEHNPIRPISTGPAAAETGASQQPMSLDSDRGAAIPSTPAGPTPTPPTQVVAGTSPSVAQSIRWESVPRAGNGTHENNQQSWPQHPQQSPVLTGSGFSAASSDTRSNAPLSGAPHEINQPSSAPRTPPIEYNSANRLVIPSQLASAPGTQDHSVVDAHDRSKPGGALQTLSVNSRRFRLDYDLGAIAPSDVARVVLWVTKDRGQTWESYGEDPDQVSPMPVEVEGEGHYGFRIVVHTRSGLVGRSPARGDDADAWIRVDLSPPVAQITSAPYGRDEWAGHLVIHWTAVDEQFRHRPIHLSYATTGDGPWTMIADGLENTGNYPWKVDSNVPARIFLRLDAIDAAGNVTTSITTEPVDLSGLVPKSRITGVEAVR
ncbi:MAG TPA: hypothetical protein PKD54_05885 [Pirellulaceae bacterium]|nr:hypothetical protein [Pirellulaceae bacterium]